MDNFISEQNAIIDNMQATHMREMQEALKNYKDKESILQDRVSKLQLM